MRDFEEQLYLLVSCCRALYVISSSHSAQSLFFVIHISLSSHWLISSLYF